MPIITTPDVLKQLRVSEDTLSRLVDLGAVPHPYSIGTAHVWDQDVIDAVQTSLDLDITLVAPASGLADAELAAFGAYANPFGISTYRHALRPGSLGLVRGGRLLLLPVIRYEIVDVSGQKPALDTSPGSANTPEAMRLYAARDNDQPLIVAFLDVEMDRRKEIKGVSPIRGGRYVRRAYLDQLLEESWADNDELRELGTLATH